MTDETESWNLLKSLVPSIPAAEEILVDEFLKSAFDYAFSRGKWRLSEINGRATQESGRSIAHDRFIDACNALSRACGRSCFSQDWRAVWGDARSGEGRKRIGDFACFVTYQLMLEAR